jgi:hypothetical protein
VERAKDFGVKCPSLADLPLLCHCLLRVEQGWKPAKTGTNLSLLPLSRAHVSPGHFMMGMSDEARRDPGHHHPKRRNIRKRFFLNGRAPHSLSLLPTLTERGGGQEKCDKKLR